MLRLIAIGVLIVLSGCRGPESVGTEVRNGSAHEFTKVAMGTKARVVIWARNEPEAAAAAAAAFDRIEQLEQVMSDYRPDSEAMVLCRSPRGEAVKISADLAWTIRESLEVSRATDGAFDITIGPVVALWRQARRSGEMPDPADLADARARVGYQLLDLHDTTITLGADGMKLDFGGIGKGLAAQAAVDRLAELGFPISMAEIGGDLSAGRAPPGTGGWKVAVDGHGVVEIAEASIATSGDTEQFVEIDGVRYSHIVDPRSGVGLTNRVAVSVYAPDGATADAVASAISVVGIEHARELMSRFDGAAVQVRASDGRWLETHGFPRAVTTFSD